MTATDACLILGSLLSQVHAGGGGGHAGFERKGAGREGPPVPGSEEHSRSSGIGHDSAARPAMSASPRRSTKSAYAGDASSPGEVTGSETGGHGRHQS